MNANISAPCSLCESQPIVIGATTGVKTFLEDSDVRMADENRLDCEMWGLDSPGIPTSPIMVNIREQTNDGSFSQIFSALRRDLFRLRLEQEQILVFCRGWIANFGGKGDNGFFPFTGAGEPINKDQSNLFVAYIVLIGNGKMDLDVFPFKYPNIWSAKPLPRHHIPVPIII